MSLMGKCCCDEYCKTTSTCACLPSSIQMTIQTFTHTDGAGTIVIPTQTVTAYKCCFAYDDGEGRGVVNRIVYRPSLIHIGYRNDTRCSPTLIVPVYLLIYLGVHLFDANYSSCVVEMYWAIFNAQYPEPHLNGNCTNYMCNLTPSVIDTNTACHFVGTNEICYNYFGNPYLNTFMQDFISSYFDDCASNCIFHLNPQWSVSDANFPKFYTQKNQCDLINVANTNSGLPPTGYMSASLLSGSFLFVVVS